MAETAEKKKAATAPKAKEEVKQTPAVSKEMYLHWHEEMLLMRRFEEKAGQLYGSNIRGFLHLYIGQEAVVTGTVSAIKKTDRIITAYRDHAHAIAAGISPNAIMAELFGKITGCSKGKGGSMHMFSKEHNFFGGHGIVGAQIPMGAGLAFADKYNGNDSITVCFMGDGAVRQGALHETFTLAMLWKLPIVFICENNMYGMGTAVERTTTIPDLYKIGLGYEMPSAQVNGMQPEDVYFAVKEAAERARKDQIPTFLEIKTYRYKGHSVSDPAKYRTREEVDEYKHKDPIEHVQKILMDNGYLTEEGIKQVDDKVKAQVEESVKFADESAIPDVSELYKDVYVQQDYPYLID